MGLADAFGAEDRVSVKFSDFYRMLQTAAEADAKLHYIQNAIDAEVPNCYIYGMLTGQKREDDYLLKNHWPGVMFGKEEEETDEP